MATDRVKNINIYFLPCLIVGHRYGGGGGGCGGGGSVQKVKIPQRKQKTLET